MAQQVKKVKFGFQRDDNYRLVPVNGVWGGATARGDIRADFFYESHTIPNEVTHELTPDNRLGNELDRKPKQDLQRTVFVGMMLTPEQAESIGRWLQEKALEIRAAKESREDKGNGPVAVTTHWAETGRVRHALGFEFHGGPGRDGRVRLRRHESVTRALG